MGFQAVDPSNLTRREVAKAQLNVVAIHMIKQVVGKEKYQIEPESALRSSGPVQNNEMGPYTQIVNRCVCICICPLPRLVRRFPSFILAMPK